jgi:hypothetical protein
LPPLSVLSMKQTTSPPANWVCVRRGQRGTATPMAYLGVIELLVIVAALTHATIAMRSSASLLCRRSIGKSSPPHPPGVCTAGGICVHSIASPGNSRRLRRRFHAYGAQVASAFRLPKKQTASPPAKQWNAPTIVGKGFQGNVRDSAGPEGPRWTDDATVTLHHLELGAA